MFYLVICKVTACCLLLHQKYIFHDVSVIVVQRWQPCFTSVTRPVMSVGIMGGHPFYLVAHPRARALKKKKKKSYFLFLIACPYFSLRHMKAFFTQIMAGTSDTTSEMFNCSVFLPVQSVNFNLCLSHLCWPYTFQCVLRNIA